MEAFEEFIKKYDIEQDDEILCATEKMCLAWNAAIEQAAKKWTHQDIRDHVLKLKYKEDPNSL